MQEEIQTEKEPDVLAVLQSQVGKILGDSGTQRYGGYFQEEPNSDWQDSRRIDILYNMRNTDSAIQAVLNAVKAPILSTKWNIETYGSTPKDIEIKDFVEKDIFNMKNRTFRELLGEMAAFMDFGFYPFEKVYDIGKDGMVHLVDLAPRIPSSVMNWQGLINGKKVVGITQLIRTDESTSNSEVFIPKEKLLILTNDKEGDDLTGRSIIRSAYIHWYYKDLLYRVSGISADRFGVGIPTVELPEMYKDKDKSKAEEGAQNVRSSEKGFMIMPPGFKFRIVTPEGAPQAGMINELVDHHNRMIMVGVLAQFLALGSDGSGSLALSSDQSSFFLKMVENKANYIAEQFTEQVIKPLVILNFGEQEWYPRLTFTPLGEKNLSEMATILNILTMSGVVKTDAQLKQWVRQTFNLPEMTDEDVEEAEEEDEQAKMDKNANTPPENDGTGQKAEMPVEEDDDEELTEGVHLEDRAYTPRRTLTQQEQRVELVNLNEQYNRAETRLEEELTAITQPQIEAYTQAVQKKLETGDVAGIAVTSFYLYGKSKDAIDRAVKSAYNAGKDGAAKELSIQRPTTPVLDQSIMSMDVEDWAKGYQYELEQRSRELIKDAAISGASAAAIAVAVKAKIQTEAARMIANMSGTIVGQWVNRGRMGVFTKNLTKIKAFQRTEVLDSLTCPMCRSLDKRVIKADDPMRYLDNVHTNCRGLWVPIYEADDDQPEVTGIPTNIVRNFDLVDGRPRVNAFQQLKKPVGPNTKAAADIIRRKMGV